MFFLHQFDSCLETLHASHQLRDGVLVLFGRFGSGDFRVAQMTLHRSKQKQWFYQDYDIAGSREMFLTLLEAVSSDLQVRVYVTGRCNIDDYSEISSVGIRP